MEQPILRFLNPELASKTVAQVFNLFLSKGFQRFNETDTMFEEHQLAFDERSYSDFFNTANYIYGENIDRLIIYMGQKDRIDYRDDRETRFSIFMFVCLFLYLRSRSLITMEVEVFSACCRTLFDYFYPDDRLFLPYPENKLFPPAEDALFLPGR